ncbi:AAA family ATPase, partial [Bdellovibrionota bacterium FG-2]
MLETMTIRNVVIIDRAEISFKKGLNIISGETGAGKSILIEAISLLLGARANIELIRTGEDEAVVEGLFNVGQISWINTRLEAHGIATMGDELLIKRVVNRNGKHRITINGELATLSNLQNICEGLVDLCSQHEHQSLLKAATQLDLLDRYGGLETQAKQFAETHGKLHGLARELRDLEAQENERSRRFDFLKFQIEELRGSALEEGEDERLHTEKQLLQSAEVRVQMAEAIRQTLESDDEGALTGLRSALSKLRSLQPLDEKITPYLEGLERAFAETEEVAMGLNRYLGSIDLNQERLESVQERLSLIADLKRKYGSNIQDMVATLTTLEEEFNGISVSENRKATLRTELE